MASYPRNSIANDKETLISCLASLDLDLAVDLVGPSMEALESNLPPIGPSECSFHDDVIPYDEDLLEAMVSLNVHLVDISIFLSNHHIFELDCLTIKPNPYFPSNFNLIIGESIDIGINESYDSSIGLQVGVHYEPNLMCRPSDSLNDEFVPIDFVIDANYNLYVEFDLPMLRSSLFGLDESLLV